MTNETFDQAGFDLRCEWGIEGVLRLGPSSDALVVVDVLSFSTTVDVAVARGAAILPCEWNDDRACQIAEATGTVLASRRSKGGRYTLAPASMETIPRGLAVVLPSPNGSTLAYASTAVVTAAGCLRNCGAVAEWARDRGARISVIPAGERWPDGRLRPAIEDLIGAGAILAGLPGRRSPEAETAVSAFERFRHELPAVLAECGSGRELIGRGYPRDIELASEYAVSRAVPVLRGDRFVDAVGG